MKTTVNKMDRRDLLKTLGIGSAAGAMGLFGMPRVYGNPGETPSYARGMAPVTIKDVKAIATAPNRANLIVVKIETSEPGLYGVGCATFTQRAGSVVTAIEKYLKPFCIGKDVDNIEDMWNSFYIDSYWRNGPVLNNAISGMDQALWDIKGKRANMPVFQLLGGRSRFAVPAYIGAGGATPEEVAADVQRRMDQGFRYVRMGLANYGDTSQRIADYQTAGYGYEGDRYINTPVYLKQTPKMFEAVRKVCGDEVELMHDIHERIQPMEAITLINNLEEYRPFFIEDPLSPENMGWFKELRQSTNVPIAMGELFNNINEFLEPMANRYFDYIRCHISQIGGLTPAMKIARLGEWFGIRTAWHGPSDVCPIGHAVHAHIDLAIWNFGIQELREFTDAERAVFPGSPTIKDGYIYINEVPGIGVDVDEKEAAKYPISYRGYSQIRKEDGTIIRP